MPTTHFIIPDAQIAPGDDTDFVEWIGRYAVDHTIADHPDWTVRWIQLGDWWDMPSLSWYDRGKKAMEGQRVSADVQAGDDAFARLNEPLEVFNARRRRKRYPEERLWLPGNHEERADRHAEDNPSIDVVGMDRLTLPDGWERSEEFNKVETREGVSYAHYFYNPATGKPYGGQSMDTRLKTIGFSFGQGHQQGLLYGMRATTRGLMHGFSAGSCYPKNPKYLGPQAYNHWRGVLVLHDVGDGNYNIMAVDLQYLARRYGKTTLTKYRKDKGIK